MEWGKRKKNNIDFLVIVQWPEWTTERREIHFLWEGERMFPRQVKSLSPRKLNANVRLNTHYLYEFSEKLSFYLSMLFLKWMIVIWFLTKAGF